MAQTQGISLGPWTSIDQYDDEKFTTSKLAESLFGLDIPSPGSLSGLGDNKFAVIVKTSSGDVLRKFPVDSPLSTQLSRAYLVKNAELLPDPVLAMASRNIRRAADHYKLAADRDFDARCRDIDASFVKSAAPTDAYNVVYWDNPLPQEDPVQTVVKLATQLVAQAENNWSRLKPEDRSALSVGLAKLAGTTFVKSTRLASYLPKPEPGPLLKVATKQREALATTPALKVFLIKAAQAASSEDSIRYLKAFDKLARLEDDQILHRSVIDPYMAAFGSPTK